VRLPEALRRDLLEDRDGVQPRGPAPAQALLPAPYQLTGEAAAARVRVNREPVEAAAPSVPGDDHRADHDAAGLGHDQRVGVEREQGGE
jgi:hypothetical protein